MAHHPDEQHLRVRQYEQQKRKILSKGFFEFSNAIWLTWKVLLHAQQNPLQVIPPESKDLLSAVTATASPAPAGRQGEKDPPVSSSSSYSHIPDKRFWIE